MPNSNRNTCYEGILTFLFGWYGEGKMPETALEIESGAELERFQPNQLEINGKIFYVLTGFENTNHKCWWCGCEPKGKIKKWCRGHRKEYLRHFEWQSARDWCIERQNHICANCSVFTYAIEVHHIVPLKEESRYFTAFNLPWNLIGFWHACHQEIHAVMRPPRESSIFDSWKRAELWGQSVMLELTGADLNSPQ
jgi:hypothetical protein